MGAADYTLSTLNFLFFHQVVDELLDDLLSLLVLVAVDKYFGMIDWSWQTYKVETGVLAKDIVHYTVDFVHLCFELHAHDFSFSLFSGYDFGGLLFYVVWGELVGRDVVDLALGDPLGEDVRWMVDEGGGEGVDIDFSWEELNFDVHSIIKLVEFMENAKHNLIR